MYGAAHLDSGKSFWRSLPRFDGEITQLFLDEFAKANAPVDKQLILCWDGAPAHRAKSLRVPERITLVSFPAYTPELNPAEKLWLLLKEGVDNECFKDLDVLERRVCRRVRKLCEEPEVISSRLSYHWWPDS